MAATISGLRWPWLTVPMPDTKSMNSRPSTSVMRAPEALATKKGRPAVPAATQRARSAARRSVLGSESWSTSGSHVHGQHAVDEVRRHPDGLAALLQEHPPRGHLL